MCRPELGIASKEKKIYITESECPDRLKFKTVESEGGFCFSAIQICCVKTHFKIHVHVDNFNTNHATAKSCAIRRSDRRINKHMHANIPKHSPALPPSPTQPLSSQTHRLSNSTRTSFPLEASLKRFIES